METWLTGEDEFGPWEAWELNEAVVDKYGYMEVDSLQYKIYTNVNVQGFFKATRMDIDGWHQVPARHLDGQIYPRAWHMTIIPHRMESSKIKEVYQQWTKVPA